MHKDGAGQAGAAADCIGRPDIRARARTGAGAERYGNQDRHGEKRRAGAAVAGPGAGQRCNEERAGGRGEDHQMMTRDTAVRMNCRSRWS